MEVAQPAGHARGGQGRGPADGGVLGETDRGGRATLAAADDDLAEPSPQLDASGGGPPRLDRRADGCAGRRRSAQRQAEPIASRTRRRGPRPQSEEETELVPTPLGAGTSGIHLLKSVRMGSRRCQAQPGYTPGAQESYVAEMA